MDPTQMEGWLRKKKSKSNMFMSDVRRWFKIQSLEGTEDELALCYFSSNKSREVKGWIFLNDIVEITEEKSLFTVISPARTMTVEAQTIGEHRLWLCSLVQLCPKAKYDGETASKYRNSNRSDEKPQPRRSDEFDSKHEEKRDNYNRRGINRENSLDRDPDGRGRNLGSHGGQGMRRSNSGEDYCNDDDRRGRGKRQSYDDNSTGSSGSRGKGHRMPNTSDDHRKGNNLNYPDASTAARMHSHISGERDENLHRGRPPPPRQSRSREESEEYDRNTHYDYHRNDNELEPYDLSKASSTLSREERLLISKENEMRRENDHDHPHENKESDEHNHHQPVVSKRKKPAPPPNKCPHPRWNSPSRRSDSSGSDEEKAIPSRCEIEENFDQYGEMPDKKKGVTIEEILNEDPVLTVDLDDSDEEEKVDFKAEKRRYANDAKAQSERDRIENAKSKPPLAPSKVAPPRLSTERCAKGGPGSSNSQTCDIDPDFVNDDWDDTDSPPKPKGKPTVQTGSQADSNWLEEDFDD